MRIVSLLMTIVFAGATALAQVAVPPPPQPAADKPAGPSLDATLKFIQDKVNQQGKIEYVKDEKFIKSGDHAFYDNTAESQSSQLIRPAGCPFRNRLLLR